MDLREALSKYQNEFSGIVKYRNGKIVYPTPQRLNKMLFTLNIEISRLKKEILKIEQIIKENKGEKSFFKKISNPVYLNHLVALIKDREYANTVKKIPYFDELFYRDNGLKIVEKLISDPEYRINFLKSIKYGTIDIKRDFIDKYNTRIEILNNRLDLLKKNLNKLLEHREVILTLLKHLKKQNKIIF